MKTYVYIDGFNLYHGCLKYTSHKWLNLEVLCDNLLPSHEVSRIKFFTAKVSARPDDPDQPNRQMIYWRALRTLKRVEIIEGYYEERARSMPVADECKQIPPGRYPRKLVKVLRCDEKGSDVNLATHAVFDGCRKLYEQAVFLSNDSDLEAPARVIRELGMPLGVFNPHEFHSKRLKNLASFLGRIRESDLAAAQFNDPIADAKGKISKPALWNQSRPEPRFKFSWLKHMKNRLR